MNKLLIANGTDIAVAPDGKATILKYLSLVKECENFKKAFTDAGINVAEQILEVDPTAVIKYEDDDIRINYIAPTTKTSLDTARLKKEMPAIWEMYAKESDVKASIKLTPKGGKE